MQTDVHFVHFCHGINEKNKSKNKKVVIYYLYVVSFSASYKG